MEQDSDCPQQRQHTCHTEAAASYLASNLIGFAVDFVYKKTVDGHTFWVDNNDGDVDTLAEAVDMLADQCGEG